MRFYLGIVTNPQTHTLSGFQAAAVLILPDKLAMSGQWEPVSWAFSSSEKPPAFLTTTGSRRLLNGPRRRPGIQFSRGAPAPANGKGVAHGVWVPTRLITGPIIYSEKGCMIGFHCFQREEYSKGSQWAFIRS